MAEINQLTMHLFKLILLKRNANDNHKTDNFQMRIRHI